MPVPVGPRRRIGTGDQGPHGLRRRFTYVFRRRRRCGRRAGGDDRRGERRVRPVRSERRDGVRGDRACRVRRNGRVGEHELNRITGTSDGYLDAVHARRDALAADLVVFVVPMDIGDVRAGVAAHARRSSSSDSRFGFSVVRPDCARVNLTFAHETGHNLGAGHGPADPGYANGYINQPGDYRTIMAYDSSGCPGGSCQRVAHFSSPTSDATTVSRPGRPRRTTPAC